MYGGYGQPPTSHLPPALSSGLNGWTTPPSNWSTPPQSPAYANRAPTPTGGGFGSQQTLPSGTQSLSSGYVAPPNLVSKRYTVNMPIATGQQAQPTPSRQISTPLPPTRQTSMPSLDRFASAPSNEDQLRLQVASALGVAAAPCRRERPRMKTDHEMKIEQAFAKMDTDRSGTISMMEFMEALSADRDLNELVLPGTDASAALKNEEVFDAIRSVFNDIGGAKTRIDLAHFLAYFREQAMSRTDSRIAQLRSIFQKFDSHSEGSISRLHLIDVMMQNTEVAKFCLPQLDCHGMLEKKNEDAFDAVNSLFDAIARGKQRINFSDFSGYFNKVDGELFAPKTVCVNRSEKRVLIIGPGFGGRMNPRQGAIVEEAGYQVLWLHQLPNPEEPNFPMANHLPTIQDALDKFRPDLVCSGSKGGAYTVAMWTTGMWSGPTVLINVHPMCLALPKNTPVVVAHGANDEVYSWDRAYLERLMTTATPNQNFLYFTPNSGTLASGQRSRNGDQHNMMSLLMYDCLPRLIEACLSGESPEEHMIRSWRERLTPERLADEAWLGYTPNQLRRFWTSRERRGTDDHVLFDVPWNSEEFNRVSRLFRARPKEPPVYCGDNPAKWESRPIIRIQRVENGMQEDCNFAPYYEAIRMEIEKQGISFEPGVHTRWCFHGTTAIDSIVNDPVSGFQPLAAGTQGASLWGSGTYFARDAKYVGEGGFAKPGPDGHLRMLMCQVAIGIPCVGDPAHHGILPVRCRDCRYNSTVDDLSSPEVFVIQHPGAAYAAYVITFQ
eukprot:CAMPEP_0117467986 /NCGR_PEP_ID=MMETSP0784-20121206/5942_1 /TAXON_ID=39447 /ORGANISM="" /LENGTH=778 /DNA_ID=CAMNT_0005261979 /DNA_START=39 /DNA_END=2375 /DNA_ORIENTATION=+